MQIAFILINVEAGSEDEVIRELKGIENIREVYLVYGVYDFVVKVEAETQQKVKETITWKTRKIDKIRSTQTLMISS
jgi:DNA-binding Lrp family transcriptional regulator